ncbi:MAG TPA: tetratricopeptide repeat protein [bacterium]|nr:tetratricopeptide repeat protein [bacterium]
MRNIEEIAAEEESRIREIRKKRIRLFFLLAGIGLGLWGWDLFGRDEMGKGAFWVTVSLVCWALSWGILKIFRATPASFLTAFLSFAFSFGLYFQTHLPSFYWGSDPAFWLSIHAGAVNEPCWSPLSYLLGQAVCFLLPDLQFSILPLLSAVVLASATYFLALDYFFQLKNKTFLGLFWVLGICLTVSVSAPFWGAGTLGSGLVTSLGFLLLLFQRALLGLEERPWSILYFLLGLLWSVHPLWGILGILCHLGSLDFEGRKIKKNLFPLLAGITPYLWVWLRAGRFFPSWGANHPFSQWLGQGWTKFFPDMASNDHLLGAFKATGWVAAVLILLAAALWLLHFFGWKAGWKTQFSTMDFWVWVVAGFGCFFYYSGFSGTLGPVSLWFVAALGGGFLKLLEKGAEKSQGTFLSGTPLAWMGSVGIVLAFSLAWLPGQGPMRSQLFFPQQHALNLLKSLPPKSILVCRDPFDAYACREARLMEPISLNAVILDEKYLDQRWYVTQVMDRSPEILFSNIIGPVSEVVKRIVADNRDLWAIHWDLPQLPPDWKDIPSAPTVLTQQFIGPATSGLDPEKAQYQFDLTVLPEAGKHPSGRSYPYFFRYVTGFDELGKYLMGQGRYPAAIHAFERSVKLDPDFQEPQTFLAQMYSKQNILEAARLEFEKTVKTHPQKINALMKELAVAQEAKDEAKTAELLDEVVHLNSELADAEYQLSKIYDQEGRSQESKSLLESSLGLNPKQLEAQLTLGRLMARLGNRIKAEQAFRAVLEIDPQNKPAQVELWKLLNKP